jgi:hypothetical protein
MDISVSDKAIARLATERIGDYPYEKLAVEILNPQGLTGDDFERFIRHEAIIQQMVSATTVAGRLQHPRDAEMLYRKEHEEIAAEAVVFWASNYLDQVQVKQEDLMKFYTNRMPVYRIPDRVQISYVEFPATNYFADADKELGQITNLNARIDEAYFKIGTNSFKDSNGVVMSESAAKQKIKDTERERMALVSARRVANEFGTELANQYQANPAIKFENVAAAKSLPVKVTPPFDRLHGLEETDFPPTFRQKAMALSEREPIAFTPIVGSNAVYVIAFKSRIPGENPTFEKVQDKVTADFKNAQALDLARKAGTNFQATLFTSLLQSNKSFAAICSEAKLPTVTLPPFSATTTTLTNLDERINLRRLQELGFELKPGQSSSFVTGPDGGWILYVRARLPFDEAKVKEELPKFVATLRQYRQGEAFNRWFSKQAEAAQVMPPREPTNAPPRNLPRSMPRAGS